MVVTKPDDCLVALDEGRNTLTLAQLLIAHITDETEKNPLPVATTTRVRRRQYLHPTEAADAAKIKQRYPGSWRPEPNGSFGVDSGYLLDSLMKSLKKVEAGDKVDVFAGLPRNRQKAAFVLRGIKPNGALDAGSNAVLAKAIKDWATSTHAADMERLRRKQLELQNKRRKALIGLAKQLLGGVF